MIAQRHFVVTGWHALKGRGTAPLPSQAHAGHATPGATPLRNHTTIHLRRGFTLVELLVSFALVLFIMTILSEAFVSAAKVFRDFKALGDMAARLRSATQLLRDDLKTHHFNGDKRISDANFWSNGPPEQGFFRIWQQSAATREGGSTMVDLEGVPSFTSTGTWLNFTANKRGNNLQDFYIADMSVSPADTSVLLTQLAGDPPLDSKYQDPSVAGKVYRSQWAEIAWFLRPNGATAGTTNLYTLYRRSVLAVQNNYPLNWATGLSGTTPPPYSASPTTGYDDISYKIDSVPNFYFNTALELTQPPRRFGMVTQTTSAGPPPVYSTTLPATMLANTDAAYAGLPICSGASPPAPVTDGSYPISPNNYVSSDVILPDVISMDVRVLIAGQSDFTDLASLPANSFINPAFNTVSINGRATQVFVYDTWSKLTDASYDYNSGWNYNYPATGPAPTTGPNAPTNVNVPLRRLYDTTNSKFLTNDIQILAIQVSLRVWDFKTEQARQITLIVDM